MIHQVSEFVMSFRIFFFGSFFKKMNLRGSSIFKTDKQNCKCMFITYAQYIFSVFSSRFYTLSHYQQVFSFYVLQISLNSTKSKGTIFHGNCVFSVVYQDTYVHKHYRKFSLLKWFVSLSLLLEIYVLFPFLATYHAQELHGNFM